MEVGSSSLPGTTFILLGGLAQLARALAWHARGHRFDPDILHFAVCLIIQIILITPSIPITLIDHPHEIFDILTQARL